MVSRDMLPAQVADAYEHLYDLVYLRSHPFTEWLAPGHSLQRKDKAWHLHHLLLQAIDDLNPGPQAPAFSHEWRRHRLMALRYVDGLDPQTVADRLAISRRQYYREHDAALAAIAAVLWERLQSHDKPVSSSAQPAPPTGASPDHIGLLRLEAARMAQSQRYTHLADVLPGVVSLLRDRLRQRQVEVEVTLPEETQSTTVDGGLLRQVLVSMIGFLVERTREATIRLMAQGSSAGLTLSLSVEPAAAVLPTQSVVVQERVDTLHSLAALSGGGVGPLWDGERIVGFSLQLRSGHHPTVLVVDDNDDVLALFQRYLGLHNYRVMTARGGEEALALARQWLPSAITLDLMMPEHDGWEILQTLLNHSDTRRIPIIVCSVLRERELALSLGATAFLEKPVNEQALLGVLDALR